VRSFTTQLTLPLKPTHNDPRRPKKKAAEPRVSEPKTPAPKPVNKNLPTGISASDFRRRLLPRARRLLGVLTDPWVLSAEEVIPALQLEWDKCYGHIPLALAPSTIVYGIVSHAFSLFDHTY
jgi:hypothetical protein